MLKVHADAKTGYLELTVDGAIKKADFEAVIAAVDELIKSNETVNVVEVVGEIGWVDVEIWWKDI
ncbi:STAS/SEC14 domain-containing protein, partial [Sphingorhabdus sp.]